MLNSEKLVDANTANRIIDLVKNNTTVRGSLGIGISGSWIGGQRWARNKAAVTSDQRGGQVVIQRANGMGCTVSTNQIDDESIISACKYVEFYCNLWAPKELYLDSKIDKPKYSSKGFPVWSEVTLKRTQDENGELVHDVTKKVKGEGLLSAGYLESGATVSFNYNRDVWGRETLDSAKVSQAHCSMTVRDPKGNGSGWGGGVSFDLARLNLKEIANLALEKCLLSLNPVRIEPGRYQTILEPQASVVFFQAIITRLHRSSPELSGQGETYLDSDMSIQRNRSKFGLKVVDDRITIRHNPTDPSVGTHVQAGVEPVTLIDNGVLTAMWERYSQALNDLVRSEVVTQRNSFQVNGTDVSVDEMIGSMKRGLIVTRLSDPVNIGNGLMTGTTRDGLWLIENGKITKSVRNFRWTESPWFVLNNVEEIGRSMPSFVPTDIRKSLSGLQPAYGSAISTMVVPWLKVNDFSFTSTIDAI